MKTITFPACLAAVVLCGAISSLPPAARGEAAGVLVLGDMHHDAPGDHDLGWLKTKPDDYRQVTTEYQPWTRANWEPLIDTLLTQAKTAQPPIRAVVQLGDLQEGLAGTPEFARQMARNAITALRAEEFAVPWLLVKGNHDITGPGAKEAYAEVVLPFLRKEFKDEAVAAHYSYKVGDIQFICLDYYPPSGPGFLSFLEKELKASKAKQIFVALHEPVIPISGRCWHVLRRDTEREAREKLLALLAEHHAIVLCGHLHKFAVVRRTTPAGPIVQVMMNSVIRDRKQPPGPETRTYGPALVDEEPRFSPETRQERVRMLEEEARFVTHYQMADAPGYGMLSVDPEQNRIVLRAYSGVSREPWREIDLAALLKPDVVSTQKGD